MTEPAGRTPLGRRRALLAAGIGVALFWLWLPLAEWLFDGQARDALPAHVLAGGLGLAAAWLVGRPRGRPGAALGCLALGFLAMAVLAAAVFYGYVLPEACERAIEEWERGQAESATDSGTLAPALSC